MERLTELYRFAALGRMVASAVHEINTPVASILSNNEVMRRALDRLKESALPPQAEQTVEALRSLAAVDHVACERISGVIRTVKRLVRREDDERAKADVNDLIRDCLALVQYEFRRRITVETDLGPVPAVYCYPHLLSQVFLNLLVNAAQAIEGEGSIRVRTRCEAGGVHAWISDTGRGVDPADQPKLFTSGFTTKPPGIGTGLGLAISKESVEKHGGTIDFESRPGEGTTFHIRIPAEGAHGG